MNTKLLRETQTNFDLAENSINRRMKDVQINGEYKVFLQSIFDLNDYTFEILYGNEIEEYIEDPTSFIPDTYIAFTDKDFEDANEILKTYK